MKAVGFKNFRNFEELPMMPIEGVTFLVGQNNSGKSTFTKACRFLAENLLKCVNYDIDEECNRSDNSLPFASFANTCKTFERALNWNQKGPMEFHCLVGYFDIWVRFTSSNMRKNIDNDRASLSFIKIHDTIDEFSWSYDVEKQQVVLDYSGKLISQLCRFKIQNLQRNSTIAGVPIADIIEKDLSEHIVENRKDITYAQIKKRKDQYLRELKILEQQVKKYASLTDARQIVIGHVDDYCPFGLHNQKVSLKNQKVYAALPPLSPDALLFDHDSHFLIEFRKHLLDDLKSAVSFHSKYFSAHETPLHSFFEIGGHTNNYANEAILSYYHSETAESYHEWVCTWLQEFGIGSDYVIELKNSEFIGVYIINEQHRLVPLADLGRGSVQIFLSLLQVATLPEDNWDNLNWSFMQKNWNEIFIDGAIRRQQNHSKLLIFEEPEQNLHPALQSKLADLFADIHKTFGYNVIVETHSEYMIRRTQALIASGEVPFENNPFRVYYFPQGELPYDMEYQESGLFRRKFDSGFFDEASKSQMDIIRRIREGEHV